MAAQDRTSIFEMREMADLSEFAYDAELLITPERVEQWPHRDVDELRAAAESCDSIREVADRLGTEHEQVTKWAAVYGVELPQGRVTIESRLADLGFDTEGASL